MIASHHSLKEQYVYEQLQQSEYGFSLIMWLCIALNRTPTIDCYWVGAVPNIQLRLVNVEFAWPGWLDTMWHFQKGCPPTYFQLRLSGC